MAASISVHLFAENPDIIPKAAYLEYARGSADWLWDHYDEVIQRWKERFDPENVFGYRPPGGLLEAAVIYSELFDKEENPVYVQRAKKLLLGYESFRAMYPDWAVDKRSDYDDHPPVLPDFFTAMRYIRSFEILKREEILSPEECRSVENNIVDSMRYLLRTQEWGPMNRAALRAETLAWAVRALPDHPAAEKWEIQRKAIGDDNWGNWEIEDATIYHAVWLYALCGYAQAMNKFDELFRTPEMYYYAQYFLNLMSPDGMVPDFGDAHWRANWSRFLVFFEAAAAQYKNPHLKCAAVTIARKFIDFSQPSSVGLGYMLLDCSKWADDSVSVRRPQTLSQEVMEDVQGKKIVFRDGWDSDATYLLLNYRDEGDGGHYFRDYLRDTIPVEEEKMTHGHSDENSIVLLMSKGSVLLHDGGYRDYMPSGPFGAYRQDYFHNRLCVRPEKIWMGQKEGQYRYSIRESVPEQPLLSFLHDAGSYRMVRTQKVDFISLDDFDYSRTRVLDDRMGYHWDRIIIYIKEHDFFVVFDIFKALEEGYFTLANLWHTRKILSRGPHWYDTVYDRIQDHILSADQHLLLFFPKTHFRLEGTLPEKRHYQDEWLIHQTTAQHFERGQTVSFITVLIPHSVSESPEKWPEHIHLLPISPLDAGTGIFLDTGNEKFIIGVKNDLRRDICRDWRRPRYTFESGKISYGDFNSDADLLFSAFKEHKARYTAVNLTKIFYKQKLLYEGKSGYFGLAFDGSPDTSGIGKIRYWRDTFHIDNNSSSKR